MLPLLLAPVLIGLSMLVQRPLSRRLGVAGQVWPLVPFVPSVPWSHRFTIRGAGLLFTFLLVLGALFLQTRREERLVPRVKVAEGSAAAAGGVETNDLITAVDGVAVDDFGVLRELLQGGSGTSTLSLVRGGVTLERTVTLREGLLGVQPSGEERETRVSEALQHATRMLVTFPFFYTRLLWRAAVDAPPPAATPVAASPGKRGATWLLLFNISLSFSWWLCLLVELAALGLGGLTQRSRG